MKLTSILYFFLLSFIPSYSYSQINIAKVKYNGGGDWYANKTALPNLIRFCNKQLETNINPDEQTAEVGSKEILNYPYLYLTGHGNIHFTKEEARNLRKYLLAGGFLHIDDNYGLDKFVRLEMKKVFPELKFIELSYNHPVFKKPYKFKEGLPKIHQHDGKRPQAFGLFWKGKLICFYSYESDLGNGWEDQSVHNNSEDVRLKALKMGANILQYAFTRK